MASAALCRYPKRRSPPVSGAAKKITNIGGFSRYR
jgi:hypothetical protein